MLNCNRDDTFLSVYLDGELAPGDRRCVKRHLKICAKCRATFEDMKRLRWAVGQLSFEQGSPAQCGQIADR